MVATSGFQEEQTSEAVHGMGEGGAGRSQGSWRGSRGIGRARGMSRIEEKFKIPFFSNSNFPGQRISSCPKGWTTMAVFSNSFLNN